MGTREYWAREDVRACGREDVAAGVVCLAVLMRVLFVSNKKSTIAVHSSPFLLMGDLNAGPAHSGFWHHRLNGDHGRLAMGKHDSDPSFSFS